jgi:hypothetical protein
MRWDEIGGWFLWRSAQEEAAGRFLDDSRFVEVGTYLGRSLCSLAEVVQRSGKRIGLIGVDTCRGSGPEGPKQKNYHGEAVTQGGGTFWWCKPSASCCRERRLGRPISGDG